MPPADLADLDGWILGQRDRPSRPEAIRRLVRQSLDQPSLVRIARGPDLDAEENSA